MLSSLVVLSDVMMVRFGGLAGLNCPEDHSSQHGVAHVDYREMQCALNIILFNYVFVCGFSCDLPEAAKVRIVTGWSAV